MTFSMNCKFCKWFQERANKEIKDHIGDCEYHLRATTPMAYCKYFSLRIGG